MSIFKPDKQINMEIFAFLATCHCASFLQVFFVVFYSAHWRMLLLSEPFSSAKKFVFLLYTKFETEQLKYFPQSLTTSYDRYLIKRTCRRADNTEYGVCSRQ